MPQEKIAGRCSITFSVTGSRGDNSWREAAKPIEGPEDCIHDVAECLARALIGTCPVNALQVLDEATRIVRGVVRVGKQRTTASKPKPPTTGEKYHPAFEEWWLSYPETRRTGKLEASKAWTKAGARIKAARSCDTITAIAYLLDRVRLFAKSPKGRGEFCPMPATWLNQGRYDDNPASWGDTAKDKGPIEVEQ